MVDLLGNTINIGDMIAYPVRQSSSMWMNYGKVVGIEAGVLSVSIRAESWRTVNPSPEKKIVKVIAIQRVLKMPASQFNDSLREFFNITDDNKK